MTILEYITTHGLTRPQFAKRIGVVHQAVSHWISGERHPRPDTAKRIIKKTDGEVTMQDIYG
jgi:DNA-binding transcriptional regulator YdaS (Cro superfamily)